MSRPQRRPRALVGAVVPAGCALLAAVALLVGMVPVGAQSELEAARAELAAARERVADVQARADEAAAAYSRGETQLAELEGELERLDAAIDVGETEIADMRDELRAMALDRYLGASEAPTILSGAATMTEALRADALADVVTGRNADVLDRYRLLTADLDAAREDAAARREEQEAALASLAAGRDAIEADLTALEEERQNVQAIVNRLEEEERRRIAEEEERRRAEEEARRQEEQRQAALAAQRQAAAAARSTPTTAPRSGGSSPPPAPPRVDTPTGPIATGDWVCPVQGAVSFTDSWGAPRSGGRRHQGVDMMAAGGTPVVAPVAGTVTHRGNSIGGLSFHLVAADGTYYYGTHLSAYGNSGPVAAGTIVGYVGATGNATTPHLHFEIHPGGRGNPVNPYPTVRANC